MSYATKLQLRQRLPEAALAELTADSGNTADDPMLDAILAEVDGLIDTAANTGGYVTPVVSAVVATMSTLRSHELSIAKFLLLDRRGLTAYDPASETLYRSATDFLSALRKGDVELAGAPLKAIPQQGSGSVLGGSEERFFGRSSGRCDPMRGI